MDAPGSCSTCGTRVPEAFVRLGRVCPACLLSASHNPFALGEGDTSDDQTRTGWEEVFPHLEMQRTVRQEAGVMSWLARDLDREGKPVVLQLVTGRALADAGGAGALLARANRLRDAGVNGVARVVDAGDLSDAFFLVTAVSPSALAADEWVQARDGGTASDRIEAVAGRAAATLETAHARDIDPGFELRMTFVDPDTGDLVLTPTALPPETDAGMNRGPTGGTGFQPIELVPGLEFGDFVLEECAGEGGGGEVWRARQERPLQRIVALKILKHAVVTPRMLARFELEQQSLARLDHPHIARLFEGGTMPDARPFFAMEWVEGTSITTYCKQKALSITDRLALFLQVCDAVQHAHQKGIIHRDIKPSNVMVGTNGSQPGVKVIDFGIARALEDSLPDSTLLTRAGEIVGTPVWMSPEQAAGTGGVDLDARTDVYSLGALLYELLSGKLPYDHKLAPDELRRKIREEDPPKPSAQTDDPATARRLWGDLDWIVMRCLEKDPQRRYASVSALASDLEHHLADEPVVAGPPELGYRLRKFVRRHRISLSVAAVVTAALVAGGIAITYGLLTAREERAVALEARDDATRQAAVAEAVSRFLSEELLTIEEKNGLLVADPRDHDVMLRSVLERAADRIEGRFDDLPEVEGVLRRTLGTSFLAVGDLEEAGTQAERSLELLLENSAEGDEQVLQAMQLLASIRAAEGKLDESASLLDRIASITGEAAPETRQVLVGMESALIQGDLHLEAGKILEAKRAYLSIASSEEISPEMRVRLASGIAQCSEHLDPRKTALQCHDVAVSFAKKNLGEKHPLTLEAIRRQAYFLGGMPESSDDEVVRFGEMAESLQKAQVETLGRDHPSTLRSRFDLALVFGELAPFAAGQVKSMEEVIRVAERIYRPDHPELLRFRLGRAIQHERAEEYLQAAELLTGIIDSGMRSVGEHHPVVVDATRLLAEQMEKLGRSDEALSLRQLAVKRARKEMPPAARPRKKAVEALMAKLWGLDRSSDATALAHEEWQASYRLHGEDHWLSHWYLVVVQHGFHHDQTGGAAEVMVRRALRDGGTPAIKIRALYQLALASQMCLRPSFFSQSPIPMPEAYYELIVFNDSNDYERSLQVEKDAPENSNADSVLPVMVSAAASWRFLSLSEVIPVPENWTQLGFDDSAWGQGLAPLGFGRPEKTTEIRDFSSKQGTPLVSACFRHRFFLPQFEQEGLLLMRLRCDDGAAIFLNGEELLRHNVDGEPLELATRALRSIDKPESHDYLVPAKLLVQGENMIAARVFQKSLQSSDLFFSLAVFANAPSPLTCLKNFDPAGPLEHLEESFPNLLEPFDDDWRRQVECTTLACLGNWEQALELSRTLATDREPAAAARLRWFQRTALERLDRQEEAEDLFRKSLPVRPAEATAEMLDLTPGYNAHFDEPWRIAASGIFHDASFASFPAGVGTFAGVSFDARGILQLKSTELMSLQSSRQYPGQVKDIPLDRFAGKIHLLNSCLSSHEVGTVAARMVVHYADGSESTFPLRHGHETSTAWFGGEAHPKAESVKVAWRAPHPSNPGHEIGLHVATWVNPRPEIEIKSIDLGAEANRSGLFVVGITVEPPQ